MTLNVALYGQESPKNDYFCAALSWFEKFEEKKTTSWVDEIQETTSHLAPGHGSHIEQ